MASTKPASDLFNDPAHAGRRRVDLTKEANLSFPACFRVSAIAMAFFSFATSIPTNASL
ncbi:hypothetical protein [Bradyrhizobium sp. USDA 3458]|uniref:hypothetical protein n=1 Tax=Bradyrhizobium sp. USDA 3458 TaxID=2591461 RepID=UPI00132FF628|nr:hypothetical protein [Bradyrhizobium sp. USDA 3458]